MASPVLPTLRRSLLYVPASSPNMLSKSLRIPSDNLTYDLEDSVTPSLKPVARTALLAHLNPSFTRPPHTNEIAVRINALSTPHALADLEAIASLPAVDTIVIPKVSSAADLKFVSDVLAQAEASSRWFCRRKPINLLALIETARGVMDLREICTDERVGEFAYARSAIVTAARAFGMESAIDLCIHPDQVGVVQRMFSPPEKEVEWAVRLLIADEKAAAAGRGAWTMDGKMIDAPVTGKAKAIIAKAERCGMDLDHFREKWKHQEPQ
ncbi:hypothetical protein N0V88_004435 [Collariella sp. IMI 366227]|nr:hypothetical protein N0V88_004435 [Collariella sp. IMI 366227]